MQYSPARAGGAIIYNFSPDCMRAVTRSSGVLSMYVIVVLNIRNPLKRGLCSAHVTKRDQRRTRALAARATCVCTCLSRAAHRDRATWVGSGSAAGYEPLL